jgi:ribonuclease HII
MNSKKNILTDIHNDEKHYLATFETIAGIDEVGRGPLAGPVVIAGIVLPRSYTILPGVCDSKKTTAKQRKELYPLITKAYQYHIVVLDNDHIDTVGIANSVVEGMNQVIHTLKAQINLIDGYFRKGLFPDNTFTMIDGDALYYSIAAASIIAKYTRDSIMDELDEHYPLYGFKHHKGYGTKEHLANLEKFGPSSIHRKSYQPIKDLL